MTTNSSSESTSEDFYVALGYGMGLALLVRIGGGLLKRALYFFGNELSLGRNSPILLLAWENPIGPHLPICLLQLTY